MGIDFQIIFFRWKLKAAETTAVVTDKKKMETGSINGLAAARQLSMAAKTDNMAMAANNGESFLTANMAKSGEGGLSLNAARGGTTTSNGESLSTDKMAEGGGGEILQVSN